MNGRYRVLNRLGVFVAGQRLATGEEVSLDNETAAPLLATGAIERASEPKPKPERRPKAST